MFTDEQFQSFRTAYIAAMLWSTNDETDEDGGRPLDENFTEDDLSDEASDRVDVECKAFLYRVSFYIDADPKVKLSGDGTDVWAHAGHDFWLTRCGHGAGFWDGDWPVYGDLLTKAAQSFGNLDPYLNNADRICF